MNLLSENIIEFLINDDFIKYVTNPDLKLEIQWDVFFKKHPNLIPIANQARDIIIGNSETYKISESELIQLKEKILQECGILSMN